jgi:hypothetical protein
MAFKLNFFVLNKPILLFSIFALLALARFDGITWRFIVLDLSVLELSTLWVFLTGRRFAVGFLIVVLGTFLDSKF